MKPKLILCLALVLSGSPFVDKSNGAIVFPKLPDGCPPMTYQTLADFCKERPFFFSTFFLPTNFLTDFKTGKIRVSQAFRCYFVKYQSILSEKLPESESSYANNRKLPEKLAREICHDYVSYMVLSGTNMLETLTVGLDAENHWQTFGAFELVGQPNPIWVAYQKAEMLPQVRKRDYEFRFVMIGSSMFFAIWLHGKSDDILIPISDGYGKWKAYKPYSVKQFANLLKPVAEDELKQGEMNRVISSAMEDYEKANGNKCGDITYLGGMSDIKIVRPDVWTCELEGISGKCGSLDYKARITYADRSYTIVKRVEILKKLPAANNVTNP